MNYPRCQDCKFWKQKENSQIGKCATISVIHGCISGITTILGSKREEEEITWEVETCRDFGCIHFERK